MFVVYSGTADSSTSYSISALVTEPFSPTVNLYFGRFVKLQAQLPAAVAVVVSTCSPSAFRITVTLAGRIPSSLLLSVHSLTPLILTFSGSCVLVMV